MIKNIKDQKIIISGKLITAGTASWRVNSKMLKEEIFKEQRSVYYCFGWFTKLNRSRS